MNTYPANLYKYDELSFHNFIYELPTLLNQEMKNIGKESIIKFYHEQFTEDYKVIFNCIVTNKSNNGNVVYINSIRDLIISIKSRFKPIIDFNKQYLRLQITDILNSEKEYDHLGELKNSYTLNDLIQLIGFDFTKDLASLAFLKKIIGSFLNQIDILSKKIEKHLSFNLSTSSYLKAPRLKITRPILIPILSFLLDGKYILTEDNEVVDKIMAAEILPKLFFIEKDNGEKYKSNYMRKLFSIENPVHDKDILIQDIYNRLEQAIGVKKVRKRKNPYLSK
jgi:hypothetical protein